MCLPIGCLKCIVEFEAILILIAGLGSFGFTIYLQIEFNLAKEDDETNKGQGILVAFWIFSSSMILNGIIGIFGGKKKSACLLLIFNLVNIALFLGFVGLTVAGYVRAHQINGLDVSTYCSNNPPLQQTWDLGQNLLCSAECQCYIEDPTNLPTAYFNHTTNSSAANRVQDCSSFDNWDSSRRSQAKLFKSLEKKYDCSGWCTPFSLQIFYDINHKFDESNNQCLLSSQQQIYDTLKLIGDISAGAVVIMGLMVIFTFCLCCHPTKKDQDYYQKLAYYDS
ncbi:unnamed protein product (macronuclear) [Paramecium tetraurelia]|uniref:Tetraspanin n=1 Tax=Paramecium tetraurelia TaxID=5888 RepID=A0EF92_PARTE|nr:uncharacterized protein GSPATT00026306001 [Paramecium tetraurelia]CAK93983.1 unnamed protein product [Paramecium tetraurelia]|eukprot:XP_001461356.1 hypothetical protein (macronuclear) [Paramecium tetraurelia strain d4-2]